MENNLKTDNNFRINAYFSEDGEELEKILATHLSNLLDRKVVYA